MKNSKTLSPAPPQSCAECTFFLQTSSRAATTARLEQKIGYCRANPPTAYFEMDSETGIISPKIGRFPVVLNNMWCGMFDYKDEAPATAAMTVQDKKLLMNLAAPAGEKLS